MAWAFWAAGAAAAVAAGAAIGDRRRARRVDADRVGIVDWRAAQLAALVAVILLVSLGLHARP